MSFEQFFPIWDKLTKEQQHRLAAASEPRKVKKGMVLHGSSKECLGLILVRMGQLRAYMLSEEGREVTISRFFERDMCIFSAACVMPNMQFEIMLEAEKDSELWIIPACIYKNMMEESLAVANYSNYLMSNHFSELMWLMEQIMWKSMDKRLAQFLLEECRLENTNCLKITHERIANHLGTAREVVTRMLRYLQSEGMIKLTRGAVEIVDEARLEKL